MTDETETDAEPTETGFFLARYLCAAMDVHPCGFSAAEYRWFVPVERSGDQR